MSLSGLVLNMAKQVYQELPTLAVGAGGSASLSYVTKRYVERFSLGAPRNTATFTVAVGLAFIGYSILTERGNGLESKEDGLRAKASRYILLSGLAYGVHTLCNPEKTLLSFAKFGGIAVASLLASGTFFKSQTFSLPNNN